LPTAPVWSGVSFAKSMPLPTGSVMQQPATKVPFCFSVGMSDANVERSTAL
jgi:hypothetical protein